MRRVVLANNLQKKYNKFYSGDSHVIVTELGYYNPHTGCSRGKNATNYFDTIRPNQRWEAYSPGVYTLSIANRVVSKLRSNPMFENLTFNLEKVKITE